MFNKFVKLDGKFNAFYPSCQEVFKNCMSLKKENYSTFFFEVRILFFALTFSHFTGCFKYSEKIINIWLPCSDYT